MTWGEAAALATAVCWSFTAILMSYSGRRVGADVVNRSRLLFAFGLLAVAHWALEGSLFPTGVEPFRWGWLGLSSLLGLVLGDAFLFRAYVLIGPRLAMLLMAVDFAALEHVDVVVPLEQFGNRPAVGLFDLVFCCLLYTSDAADE